MAKASLLHFLVPAILLLSAWTSSPAEQLSLEIDPSSGDYLLQWPGTPGRTYFLQSSEDLRLWEFASVIRHGDGTTLEWESNTLADKLFIRLQYTDLPTG